MYDENSFKNYIFWIQVKRVFLIIIFSIVGAFIGILLSQFLIDILLLFEQNSKVVIIAVSTLLFFSLSLLLTAGTGKEVQEGYWKMAVLRKLTVISKKLDYLENLKEASPEQKETTKQVLEKVNEELTQEITQKTVQEEIKQEITQKVEEKNILSSKKKKKPSKKKITKLAKK